MPPVLSETLIWCVTLLLFGMGLIGTLIPMPVSYTHLTLPTT